MEKNGAARLKMPVLVIAATADSIDAAISDDNQSAKQADLHVKLSKPMNPPAAVGSSIDVIGVITSYRPKPFMFFMDKGEVAPAPSAPRTDSAH